MEQRRVVIAGIVAVLAALLVLGAIFYFAGLLTRGNEEASLPVVSFEVTPTPLSTGTTTPNVSTPTPTTAALNSARFTPTPTPTLTPTPTPKTTRVAETIVSGDLEQFSGVGFSLSLPASWGVLTCTNSNNIELDPTSDLTQKVVCGKALKPVTILIKPKGSLSCPGDKITLGSYSVTKSKKVFSDGYVAYKWCFDTATKSIEVSHRVSQRGERATSKTDFSTQVETIIASFK